MSYMIQKANDYLVATQLLDNLNPIIVKQNNLKSNDDPITSNVLNINLDLGIANSFSRKWNKIAN